MKIIGKFHLPHLFNEFLAYSTILDWNLKLLALNNLQHWILTSCFFMYPPFIPQYLNHKMTPSNECWNDLSNQELELQFFLDFNISHVVVQYVSTNYGILFSTRGRSSMTHMLCLLMVSHYMRCICCSSTNFTILNFCPSWKYKTTRQHFPGSINWLHIMIT